MGHARLSPSGAHRWMDCPGSVREEAKYPDQPNVYSIDGTHTHTLLEACLKDGLKDPMLFVGTGMEDHEGAFVVDVERAARVTVAVNYVKKRTAELGVCAVRTEEKVDAGAWVGRDDLTGTADIQLVGDDVLEVIDYKDGVGEVVVKENPQLLTYALGAAYPYLNGDGGLPFHTIRLTVIQPKLAQMGKDPVSSWDATLDELVGFAEDLYVAAEATDAPDAPLAPGDVQCKWCKARGACEARASKALEGAQVLFAEVNMAQQVVDQDINVLSDDKIREIIEALPLLKQLISDIEAEALRRFDAGHVIPGLKVVKGRGSRDWAVAEDAVVAKLKGMGVPKDSIYVTKMVSPAQAEKIKWTNRKGEHKSLSAKQMATVEGMILKRDGKPTVVPASDSRPGIAKDVQSLFANVTVETKATVETEKPSTEKQSTEKPSTELPGLPAWLQ